MLFQNNLTKIFLFNIKTGTQALKDVERYLLILFKCGDEKKDVFVSECSSTSEGFVKPIRKTIITTFASENFERKYKLKKVAELQVTKGTRDLFRRLLYRSATNGIDFESVFSFPILPELACFTYPDGTVRQNNKSAVFHHLTKDFQFNPPDTIGTAIADGMFISNLSTQNLPKTYSALVRRILVKVLNLTNIRTDLCFDIYESPSIKDVRGKDCGDKEFEREFCIGPRLKIPSNFNELLKSHLFVTGVDSDNSRNYVDISKLSKDLDYVKALPGVYAYTSIDYLPVFYRKGKVRPLSLMTKKQKFVNAFVTLGNLDLSENIMPDIEEFTCHMYGYSKNKCINDVLKTEFDKKCKPKPGKNPVDCIKSVDSTTLPPCSKVLLQQIKRAYYVVHLYTTAYDAYLAFDLFPIDYGYQLSQNGESLEIHWFDWNQTPNSIEKLETDGEEGNNSDEVDADVGDSDSEDEGSNNEFDDAQI